MSATSYSLIGSLITSGLIATAIVLYVRQRYTKKAKRQLKQTMHALVIDARADAASSMKKRPADYNPIEEAAKLARSKGGPGRKTDLKSKLFQAGLFFESDAVSFQRRLIASLVVAVLIVVATLVFGGNKLGLSVPLQLAISVLILFAGYALPFSRLDRKITLRNDEISYHLPLTIEQIAIGVSSGLDIWPCITNIITMTVSRNTVTPIVELLMQSDRLTRSGMSVPESLRSVGDDCGNMNLKHAFVFLAQVAEHGGDVSRNLQEMADATMIMRTTEVEGKIHALPVKATMPLCCVFAGFFGIMMAGLAVQLMNSFPSGDQAQKQATKANYEAPAEQIAGYQRPYEINPLTAPSAAS